MLFPEPGGLGEREERDAGGGAHQPVIRDTPRVAPVRWLEVGEHVSEPLTLKGIRASVYERGRLI